MSGEPDAPDELETLIEAYADGDLDSGQARRLLELIESSPEIRARVANRIVVERLLRTLGTGAVPSERIMAAVKARAQATASRTPPRPGGTRRARSPLLAGIALAAIALAATLLLRSRPDPTAVVKPPVARAEDAHSQRSASPIEGRATPLAEPSPTAHPEGSPYQSRSLPQSVALRPVYPLDLPPPPADVAEPAPPGDGSAEDGFVPPPAAAVAKPPEVRAGAEAPLLWTKVYVGAEDRWEATPNDIPALLASLHERMGVRYRANRKSLDEMGIDPAGNPVLLFSTHYRFTFTPEQRARLRRFLLAGGMIVFDAGLGSAPAYDAARRETRLIFPDLPLQRLEEDHPLFHAGFDIARVDRVPGERPWLDGVSIDCRTAVVISRWGLAAGWSDQAGQAPRAYAPDDARRLGINLSTYAASVRAWATRAGGNPSFPVDLAPDAGRMSVAQVVHAGEWQTRPAALALLLHAYNRQTDVPVKLRVQELRLDDPEIFRAPLLYLTGHEALAFRSNEMEALRKHLENGGFLLAESCCGRRAFDQSFRALLRQVLPGRTLEAVPVDDPLFQSPHRIERLATTRSLTARGGSMLIQPRLEGIRIGPHFAVVYSPYGLAGSWESTPVPYADAYDDPGALKLGQNILHYAITH